MTSDETRRFELKHFARRLRALVQTALNEADPMMLIADGAPEDEYSPEISPIVAQLARLADKPTAAEVASICRSVFDDYFGGVSRMEEAFDRMAENLVEHWDDLRAPG